VSGKVIGFFSAPGGVGKTTIAMLLGWKLRERGLSVLMVDMDPSVSLSWLLVRRESDLIDYEKKGRTLSRIIKKVVEEKEEVDLRDYVISRPFPSGRDLELDVVISDMDLVRIVDSYWFGSHARREYMLSNLLGGLGVRSAYDCTLLDTIPFYDRKYAVLAVYAADRCVVPLRPSIIDAYRTGMMLRELPEITGIRGEELFPRIGLVFNMVRRGTKQERFIERYVELFREKISARLYIFSSTIPYRISFSRLGTEEEQSRDREDVNREFSPFFEEFCEWAGF